jgi:hypothetical protein
MRCTPGDPCGIHAPAGNLLRAIVVALPRLVIWHRPRWPRLCQLTGTRSQQAAIVLAVRPVVRELLPGLEAAGLEVGSIVLLPTLAGSAGEPLQAQVEQETSTRSYLIRLAHMVGGMLRRPEQVAGALAEELLGLYRDAGAVTIVRQTRAAIPAMVATASVEARKNGRSWVVPLPRAAVKNEAEETVVPFKASPLGRATNGQAD